MFEDILGREIDYTQKPQTVPTKLICNGKVNRYNDTKDKVWIRYVDLTNRRTYLLGWRDAYAFLQGWKKDDMVIIEFQNDPLQVSINCERYDVKTKKWDTVGVLSVTKV